MLFGQSPGRRINQSGFTNTRHVCSDTPHQEQLFLIYIHLCHPPLLKVVSALTPAPGSAPLASNSIRPQWHPLRGLLRRVVPHFHSAGGLWQAAQHSRSACNKNHSFVPIANGLAVARICSSTTDHMQLLIGWLYLLFLLN